MAVIAGGRPKPEFRGLSFLTKWKQDAIEVMLNDDELMKLMYYDTEDWNMKPAPTMDQREELINTQIYKYRFIDSGGMKKKSYVSMGVSGMVPLEEYQVFSNKYLEGYFYFYVLCERDIMNTNAGVRSDLIAERLYHLFEGTEFGTGKIRMESFIEFWSDNNTHGGYTIGFNTAEMR